jgi:arginine repressor
MSNGAHELKMIVKAIVKTILESPKTYNRKDIWQIVCGSKKGKSQKYKFTISRSRLSGILDLLELFKVLSRNEKGLYSIGRKENLTLLEIEA